MNLNYRKKIILLQALFLCKIMLDYINGVFTVLSHCSYHRSKDFPVFMDFILQSNSILLSEQIRTLRQGRFQSFARGTITLLKLGIRPAGPLEFQIHNHSTVCHSKENELQGFRNSHRESRLLTGDVITWGGNRCPFLRSGRWRVSGASRPPVSAPGSECPCQQTGCPGCQWRGPWLLDSGGLCSVRIPWAYRGCRYEGTQGFWSERTNG